MNEEGKVDSTKAYQLIRELPSYKRVYANNTLSRDTITGSSSSSSISSINATTNSNSRNTSTNNNNNSNNSNNREYQTVSSNSSKSLNTSYHLTQQQDIVPNEYSYVNKRMTEKLARLHPNSNSSPRNIPLCAFCRVWGHTADTCKIQRDHARKKGNMRHPNNIANPNVPVPTVTTPVSLPELPKSLSGIPLWSNSNRHFPEGSSPSSSYSRNVPSTNARKNPYYDDEGDMTPDDDDDDEDEYRKSKQKSRQAPQLQNRDPRSIASSNHGRRVDTYYETSPISGSSASTRRSDSEYRQHVANSIKKISSSRDVNAKTARDDFGREVPEYRKVTKEKVDMPKIAPQASVPCMFFNKAGGCKYGNACRFGHFTPEVEKRIRQEQEEEADRQLKKSKYGR